MSSTLEEPKEIHIAYAVGNGGSCVCTDDVEICTCNNIGDVEFLYVGHDRDLMERIRDDAWKDDGRDYVCSSMPFPLFHVRELK